MKLPNSPLLYLITEGRLDPANFYDEKARFLDMLETASEWGVDLIQIREKHLDGRMLFELTAAAVELVERRYTRILVNERFDIAIAAGAHGVHLPAIALPAATVRGHAPNGFLIGVSTHDLSEVRSAVETGADFATFGPVFDSPGKGKPIGADKLRQIRLQFRGFPLLALGGVDETNLDAVLEAGVAGVAAIRLFNDPRRLRDIAGRMKGR